MIEEISSTEEIENLYKTGSHAPYIKVENGYGYYGVLVKDRFSGKIQCHICGKFFESMAGHAIQKHKEIDYKGRFGFPNSMPLCSSTTSGNYRAGMIKTKETSPKASNLHFKKNHKQPRGIIINGYTHLSTINEKDICPEQLLRRYKALSIIMNRDASLRDIRKYDSSLLAIINGRFHGLKNFKNHYGLGNILKRHPNPLDKDKIIVLLRKYAKENNVMPRVSMFRTARNGYPTITTILSHFGSWNRALSMAGLIR